MVVALKFVYCLLLLCAIVCYYSSKVAAARANSNRDTIRSNNKKNKLTTLPVDSLNVTALTWNLGEKSPTESDCSFLRSFRSSDVVVLGVQECEDIKPRRHEGRRSRKWRQLQQQGLGRAYECLAQHKIGGIQIAVYIKKKYRGIVEGIQVIDVACGVGNVLSNKGGIAVLVRANGKTVVFINAHMAAHQNKVKDRNADYKRIMDNVIEKANSQWTIKRPYRVVGTKKSKKRSKSIRKVGDSLKLHKKYSSAGSSTIADLSNFANLQLNKVGLGDQISSTTLPSPILEEAEWWCPFDAIVVMGDFNYRIDLPRLEIESFVERHKNHLPQNAGNNDSQQNSDNRSCSGRKSFDCRFIMDGEGGNRVSRGLRSLLQYDQLRRQKLKGNVFRGFIEGPIDFPPTFKYDKNSDRFDSSSKQRVPAWTDRILYALGTREDIKNTYSPKEDLGNTTNPHGTRNLTKMLQLKEYYSISARSSDHRPVCAEFNLSMK